MDPHTDQKQVSIAIETMMLIAGCLVKLLESASLPTMPFVAAATVAQSVKRPGLRSLKRGATELMRV